MTRDTLIYVIGSLAVAPFSLVSVVVLTRLLNPTQYGQLAVLFVLAGFATIIYNTGSLHGTFMWTYGMSEGDAGDDVEVGVSVTAAPRRALGSGVVLTLIIVSVCTTLWCLLAPQLTHVFVPDRGVHPSAMRWAAVSAGAGSLWRLCVNVFRMERRTVSFAAFNALRPGGFQHHQIPELVLQDDGHLFRILRQQPWRNIHAFGGGQEGDEEMVLAGQAMLGGVGQHAAQHATQRIARQHIVSNMIGRHHKSSRFARRVSGRRISKSHTRIGGDWWLQLAPFPPCYPGGGSRSAAVSPGFEEFCAGRRARARKVEASVARCLRTPRLTELNPSGLQDGLSNSVTLPEQPGQKLWLLATIA